MQTYPTGPGNQYLYTTSPTAGYIPPVYDEGITAEQQIRIEAAHAAAQIFTGLGANQGARFKAMASLIEKWIAEGK